MVRNRSGVVLVVLVMEAGFAGGCRTVSKGLTETVLEHEQVKQCDVEPIHITRELGPGDEADAQKPRLIEREKAAHTAGAI